MMKEIVSRMLKGVGRTKGGSSTMPSSPEAGQVYSFHLRPYTEFSPSPTGRYAAIKIIGADDKHVGVAVLEGVWSNPPIWRELCAKPLINEHRFACTGRPAVFGLSRDWWKPERDLEQFTFVGTQPLSRAEKSFFAAIASYAPGSSFSALTYANVVAEGEWRWANDREAFVIEVEKEDAKDAAERAAKAERYRTRLKKLTWDQLEAETPFERWKPSPPFPPEEFTAAALATIRGACDALKKLGPKPRRADVRAILKKTVIWFNEADEKAGGVIETEEREDIFAVLEEMAHVARQKGLVDEIDEWREW